ncbi:MAG TPA: hypothetical protein VLZ06_10300, partial [Solirubrobacteraceae bacterium]|nr:hypothetical protein [Solirubrobacteraceae bacterium]
CRGRPPAARRRAQSRERGEEVLEWVPPEGLPPPPRQPHAALGVCLGAQLLAEVAGGRVTRTHAPEIGWRSVQLEPAAGRDPLLGSLPERFEGFQWHSYQLTPPPGASVLARSAACRQAFRVARAPWWGIQFHAEVTGESIDGWSDDYRSYPDAVAAAIDWTALRDASRRQIGRWNSLGAQLYAGFLEHAGTLAAAR